MIQAQEFCLLFARRCSMTLTTLGWVLIFLGVVLLAVLVVKFYCWLRAPFERREAYAFWLRQRRGEFAGQHVWLPDNYEKYVPEFEAGLYPDEEV
jgi:hypothetical protein